MAEVGIGGGHGDLNQQHELEVDDDKVFEEILALCVEKLQEESALLPGVEQLLTKAMKSQRQAISWDLSDQTEDLDELPIERLVPLLVKCATKAKQSTAAGQQRRRSTGLPKQITFPYSRHSSYEELCILLEAFKPKDIHPCTVDERNWGYTNSMAHLFGHMYEKVPNFTHDRFMMSKADETGLEEVSSPVRETQESQQDEILIEAYTPSVKKEAASGSGSSLSKRSKMESTGTSTSKRVNRGELEGIFIRPEVSSGMSQPTGIPSGASSDTAELTPSELKEALQHEAYDAVLGGSGVWSLVSVDGHQVKEEEL